MGLDVYLYRYGNFDYDLAREKEAEERVNALWTKPFDEIPESEREEIRRKAKAIYQAMGLNDWGQAGEPIDIPSAKHPDHLFRIGYWRSSYNAAGINSILGDTIGKSLYDLIDDSDAYIMRPDWEEILDRAQALRDEFAEWNEVNGKYFVEKCTPRFILTEDQYPTSAKEALERFLAETQEKSIEGSWSNAFYEFRTGDDTPLKVVAIAYGKSLAPWDKGPCFYLISINDDKYDRYVQSLDIVVETIEYVLDQPDPENYVLHWSG